MLSRSFKRYFGCPTERAWFRGPCYQGSFPATFKLGDVARAGGSDCVDAEGLQQLFNVDEIVEHIRRERYMSSQRMGPIGDAAKAIYYALRPALPVGVRKHLQRVHLRQRRKAYFPQWPIDDSVDLLMREVMVQATQCEGRPIPFIWFWPEGLQSCVVMTHDVEEEAGRAFCSELMSMDESYGIVSSLQVIPEVRYKVTDAFLDEIRSRGFELNVHDLRHSFELFNSREYFLKSIPKLKEYADRWNARGFRAGAMYRNADFIEELPFEYDMSFPSAAHLEPQPGGCCTVMPYFLGKVVELPLTTTQDYTLLHILRESSIEMWKQQIEWLRERNGLITFITHPDYMINSLGRRLYLALLEHLADLRREGTLWFATPAQVADWWRDRGRMSIVRETGQLHLVGPGADRARLAFAWVEDGRLHFDLCDSVDRCRAMGAER